METILILFNLVYAVQCIGNVLLILSIKRNRTI